MHNSTYRDGDQWWGWSIDYRLWPDPPFYMEMINEPYFQYQMKKRWESLRQNEFSTENLFHYIDSIAENLTEASERNFTKWPNLGVRIWRELPGFELFDTYPKQVYSLKSYLEKRWDWIDQEMAKVSVYSVIESNSLQSELIMYPNPATNYLNVDLTLETSEKVKLKIYNSLGILVHQENAEYKFAGKNHTHIQLPAGMQAGVYLLQAEIGETNVISKRFIKGR
jgi:hypothetical protein